MENKIIGTRIIRYSRTKYAILMKPNRANNRLPVNGIVPQCLWLETAQASNSPDISEQLHVAFIIRTMDKIVYTPIPTNPHLKAT
jgi:hypothetical protein